MLKNLGAFLIATTFLTSSAVHAMIEDEPETAMTGKKPKTSPSCITREETPTFEKELETSLPSTYLGSGNAKKADLAVLESYFEELSSYVSSYRVFTIWGAGEKELTKGYKSYIGGLGKQGNDKRAITWFNLVHQFLEASKKFKGRFIFELCLDDKTFKDNNDNITLLQQSFPQLVKLTKIEDLLKKFQPQIPPKVFSLLEHIKEGNPAVGADILRVLKLYDPNYELSVYADPDSFVRHLKYSKQGYKSKKDKEPVFLTYRDIFRGELAAARRNQTLMRSHYVQDTQLNEYLISKGDTQAQLKECFEIFRRFLDENDMTLSVLNWYKSRSKYFMKNKEYNEQLEAIFKKIEVIFSRFEKNKLMTIDLNNAVTHSTGPSSCLYLPFENVLKNLILRSLKGTWTVDRTFLNIEGFDTFCTTMRTFYPDTAVKILTSIWKVRWMIQDVEMMASTQEHEEVNAQVRTDLLNLAENVRNLLNTSKMPEQKERFRSAVIEAIDGAIKKDKIWFSKIDLIPTSSKKEEMSK